jgi:predicted transcriptional regulator
MTTAVRFPKETHTRLTQAAEERDLSVNWMVNRAVEDFLDRLIPVEELRLTRRDV